MGNSCGAMERRICAFFVGGEKKRVFVKICWGWPLSFYGKYVMKRPTCVTSFFGRGVVWL